MASLIGLFFNWLPVLCAGVLCVCMRYLYMKRADFGAVGYICVFVTSYLFLFEVALAIGGGLFAFFSMLLAIELGVMMLSAGIYKYILGYLNDTGFEYALVNPSWGKLSSLFKKLSPSSWFFKLNNYGAFIAEIITGICFFIPETRPIAAFLLFAIFAYIFVTVRVNVIALLMMSLSLLFLEPMPLTSPLTPVMWAFVAYITLHIIITILDLLRIPTDCFKLFKRFRPYFPWAVFAPGATHYFIKIENAQDDTQVFPKPHHHESSLLLQLFSPFHKRPLSDLFAYAKSLSTSPLYFTIMHIVKTPTDFQYIPYQKYYVDPSKGEAYLAQSFTPDGIIYERN
jgi:hypothetical protein